MRFRVGDEIPDGIGFCFVIEVNGELGSGVHERVFERESQKVLSNDCGRFGSYGLFSRLYRGGVYQSPVNAANGSTPYEIRQNLPRETVPALGLEVFRTCQI